jgi:hypothetical protein
MFAPQPESPPTSKEGRRRASADALRRCCLLAWAFLFAVANAGTVSAGGKVDICHFQPDEGTWKRLSVGGNASASHLEKHDDALPGGTTTRTGTALDAECVKVTVTCPCLGMTREGVTWDETFTATQCFQNPGGGLSVDNDPNAMFQGARLKARTLDNSCYIITPTTTYTLATGMSELELHDCFASIREIALNNDVVCPATPQ